MQRSLRRSLSGRRCRPSPGPPAGRPPPPAAASRSPAPEPPRGGESRLVMLRQRAVKIQPVGAGGQGHGGLPGRLGLQARHLLRRQVGWVGDDQVQPALGSVCQLGEQVPFHHLHRGRGPAGRPSRAYRAASSKASGSNRSSIPPGTASSAPTGRSGRSAGDTAGLPGFFPGRRPGHRAAGLSPPGPGSRCRRRDPSPGGFPPVQQPDGRLGHHLGVGTGAEDPRPHRQLKGQKGHRPQMYCKGSRPAGGPSTLPSGQLPPPTAAGPTTGRPGPAASRNSSRASKPASGQPAASRRASTWPGPAGGQAGGHHRPSSGRSGQHRPDRLDGHLDHAVVRFKDGQPLDPQARLPDDAAEQAVRPAAPFEHLVADAHHHRQQSAV